VGIKPSDKLVSDLISTASQQRNLNVYEQTISLTDSTGKTSNADYLLSCRSFFEEMRRSAL